MPPLQWTTFTQPFTEQRLGYIAARAALTAAYGLDNPLQMASCISSDSDGLPVLWQGTMDGFFRIGCAMDSHANAENFIENVVDQIVSA